MVVTVTVTVKGPLFDGRFSPILRQGMQAAIENLVKLGEQRLDQMLRPRPGGVYLSVVEAQPGKASTGHYRRNVHGRVDNLYGLITDGGVVYGPWLEGIGSRNQTTRFKGYASFRRTGEWLQQQVPKVVAFHTDKIVRSLNGS